MIYRHLVRSRYLSLDNEYPSGMHALSNLSILRVSKPISHEAMEILYSDNVFRFVVDSYDRGNCPVYGKLAQLKRVASMMKNVDIDIDGYSLETAELYRNSLFTPHEQEIQNVKDLNQSLDASVDPFGGTEVKRENLHVRFLDCCPTLLGSTLFSAICQRLMALVCFRIITVEVERLASRASCTSLLRNEWCNTDRICSGFGAPNYTCGESRATAYSRTRHFCLQV